MARQDRTPQSVGTANFTGTYTTVYTIGCLTHITRSATTANAVNVLSLDLGSNSVGSPLNLGYKIIEVDLLCNVATQSLTNSIQAHLYRVCTTLATPAGSGTVPVPLSISCTVSGKQKTVDTGNMRRLTMVVTSPAYDTMAQGHYSLQFCIPCKCTTLFKVFGIELVTESPGINV